MKLLIAIGLGLACAIPASAASEEQAESMESLIELVHTQVGEDVEIGSYGNLMIVTAPKRAVPAQVNARLQQRISAKFHDQSLEDVIDFLRKATNLNFIIDPEVVASAAPISIDVESMRLGNVLNWIEKLGGVTITYSDQAFYVSHGAPKETGKSIRVYDVTDVVTPVPDFPGPELALDGGNGHEGGGFTFKPAR
jgi:hypothetical protein